MSRPRLLADHDLNEHLVRGVGRREPAIECIRARDIGMHERSDADRRGSVAGDTRHPQPMPCLGYGALQGCYRGYFSADTSGWGKQGGRGNRARRRSYSQALRAHLCALDPGCPNRNVPQGAWQGGEVPASTFTQEEVGSNTTRNGEGIRLRDTLAILMRSC